MAFKDMTDERKGELSETIKLRVDKSRRIQENRYRKSGKIFCNAQMGTSDMDGKDTLELSYVAKAVQYRRNG